MKQKKDILHFSQGTGKVLSKMSQFNTLNVKLSNSQLSKSKSRIKNGTEVTLKISLNVVGKWNDEDNFPHKLLLTNT